MANPKVTSHAGLIAAIPALLGFTPTDSVAFIAIAADNRVAFAARIDIKGAMQATRQVVAAAATNQITTIVPVAITADQITGEAVAAVAAEVLITNGITVPTQLWTEAITAGSRWTAPETGESGTLPDPQATEAAAHRVLAGRSMDRDRHTIADEIAPTGSPVAAPAPRRLDTDPAAAVSAVAAIARRHATGSVLSDDDAATIGTALRDTAVRDTVIGMLATDARHAITAVCIATARRTDGPARSDAAAVYAMGMYIDGDGTRALIAAKAAKAADPLNTLADLLLEALSIAAPPSMMRRVAEAAAE
ncbi:DUF4192 domain-containing protein (plasmid) [Tomitella fengzijianii]|uniref:DUF4192 domain-containing protein n=1 Tax=Tomitella fengzijianii TaxID=2597660 RepID=A0A516X8U5_9ACTN|nr:DUF4192 domain-containing protein [Tomitella fengzijianii]QDQ99487.1 DUF4192 domain-containing protein [Tomitella fengzijianii]